MRRLEQRDALGDERVEIERFRIHRRLARKLRERPHAPLQRLDLADDDLRGLLHERAVGVRLAREHLLDGQANRRQRVLQLVRRLAGERLPARHLRQVDEPLAVAPQLLGHVVERVDGASHLVVARSTRCRRSQSPAAKSVSPAVSCRIGRLMRCAMKSSGASETSQTMATRRSSVSVKPRRRSRASIDPTSSRACRSFVDSSCMMDAAQVAA